MDNLMNRELFRRMKVCTECGKIYGFWHYQSGHVSSSGGIDYYQKCGCKTAKPDMPYEKKGQKGDENEEPAHPVLLKKFRQEMEVRGAQHG